MEIIESLIQHLPRFSTVLVACDSASYARDLIATLGSREISVLGPAYTPGQALTFASHAGADLAVVQIGNGEAAIGPALAQELERTWGIPALLVQAPA